MENKILEIVNEIMENKNGNKIDRFNGELSLVNDLDFDSFDLAELTVRIEDEFGVDIFEAGIIDKLNEVKSAILGGLKNE